MVNNKDYIFWILREVMQYTTGNIHLTNYEYLLFTIYIIGTSYI